MLAGFSPQHAVYSMQVAVYSMKSNQTGALAIIHMLHMVFYFLRLQCLRVYIGCSLMLDSAPHECSKLRVTEEWECKQKRRLTRFRY